MQQQRACNGGGCDSHSAALGHNSTQHAPTNTAKEGVGRSRQYRRTSATKVTHLAGVDAPPHGGHDLPRAAVDGVRVQNHVDLATQGTKTQHSKAKAKPEVWRVGENELRARQAGAEAHEHTTTRGCMENVQDSTKNRSQAAVRIKSTQRRTRLTRSPRTGSSHSTPSFTAI